MENRYLRFRALRRQVEELLKQDELESALIHIFDFIESNQSHIETRIPQSMAIGISASISRLKQAFSLGLIEWNLTDLKRSLLVEECMTLLEYLGREMEEGTVEKRSYPHIGSFPHLFVVRDALENIENLLSR